MKMVLSVSLLTMAALLPLGAQAQVLCALGSATPPYEPMADMPAAAAAQAELKKVKSLLCPKGCGKVLMIANATAPNTAMVTDGLGTSKIAYSPTFVSSVKGTYGPIATLALFAHQLGHHLEATGNRPAWMNTSWDGELRADAWAGCAMAKAELKASGLQAALLALSTYPSTRHPAWAARRPVITEGYKQCGGRVLPPLGKEGPEPAERTAARTDGGNAEEKTATGEPAGCTGDRDCRNGRTCVNSRCGVPPERRRCGKDTDCPDPEECDSTGHCGGPAGQARAGGDQVKPAGPMLAALQSERATPATPASTTTAAPTTAAREPASCARACEDVRNLCVATANNEAGKCVAAIQADPNYRACSCPTYPAGNAECYRVCTSAYERGKSCSTVAQVQGCRTDGEACRSQCK